MSKVALAEHLKMSHLEPESAEQLMESVKQSAVTASPELKPDPRDKEVWSFDLDWTDTRGQHWAGTFTNHILSIAEQQLVAVLKARMLRGLPVESFDGGILLLNSWLAHMMTSLQKKPEWAADLTSLRDVKLIEVIWEKVASHEGRFFRLGEDAPGSPQ